MTRRLLPVLVAVTALGASVALAGDRFKAKRAAATVDVEVTGGVTLFLPDGTCTQNVDMRVRVPGEAESRRVGTRALVLPESICAGLKSFSVAAGAAAVADGGF